MSESQFFPPVIWEILESHNVTPENSEKLRTYFSSPSLFDPTRRTIVFSTPSRTGTSFFRLEMPLYAIALHYPEKFNLIYADNMLGPKHIQAADLIIAHRAGHLHDFMHSVLRVYPQTYKRPLIIHDVDDNEFNLPMRHPMREMWYAAEKDKMSIRSLKESDYITTTGFKLRQTFRNFNLNVEVFRNMFDWEQPQWKLERKWPAKDGRLVIGWIGLTSHYEDIKRMVPIMKYIHDKYPNTDFVLSGMAIKDTEVNITVDANGQKKFDEKEVTDQTKTYRYRVKELFKDFDPNRVEFHDAISLEEYGRFYKDIDIGLAYLENLTFNQCKCLVAGSLVATDKGLISIENITPELDLKTAKGQPIIANIHYKNERCVRLITANGYEIEGTVSHRIKNLDGEWRNLDSLVTGDFVKIEPYQIQGRDQYLTFPMLLNKYGNANIEDGVELNGLDNDSLPKIKVNEKWAEFFGMFLGDGHMDYNGAVNICFNSRDNDLVQHFYELGNQLGLRAVLSGDKRFGNVAYVRFCSKNLLRLMTAYTMFEKKDGQRALAKVFAVPRFILNSPKNVIARFLCGLFEADGTVNKDGSTVGFVSKSKTLARQVQTLLLGFGIKSNLKERIIYKNSYWNLTMPKKSSFIFAQQIGFLSNYKRGMLANNDGQMRSHFANDWDWSDRIVLKEYTTNDVYDIEVADTHEYNSGGFVSHNSEIKVVEYMKYGIVPIWMNLGGYKDMFQNIMNDQQRQLTRELAIETENPQQWKNVLEMVVQNYEKYKQIAFQLRDFVENEYDINKQIHTRVDFYTELIENHLEKETNRIQNILIS